MPTPESAAHHDLGVEHGDEGFEIAVAGGRHEGVDELALAAEVRVRHGRLALHTPAGAAGQLARRLGRSVDDRRDLVEGHGEDVVQHEREALGRAQRVEYDEQCDTDGVSEQRLVLGVGPVRRVDDGVGHVRRIALLASGLAGAQHVEGHPRDHRGEPGPEVFDVARVGPAEAQPGVLDGVVGVAEGAQHAVGHGPEVGAVLLELLVQPVGVLHGHRPPAPRVIATETRRARET